MVTAEAKIKAIFQFTMLVAQKVNVKAPFLGFEARQQGKSKKKRQGGT